MRLGDHKQWSEASNPETREERSIFNSPQPQTSFYPALSSHLPTVGLQNSSALSQMPMYPSRFYYQYYTPPPYLDQCLIRVLTILHHSIKLKVKITHLLLMSFSCHRMLFDKVLLFCTCKHGFERPIQNWGPETLLIFH